MDVNCANNFLKTKANKRFAEKQLVRVVKSKPKALRHFKVDPFLKIDETFHKQAETMC